MRLYCLSGLGVDYRAFKNISPKDITLIHIPWIDPKPSETLTEYSIRLFNTVNPEDDYSLIGVSFGGMIAAEFAKLKQPKHLFLISTINSKKELSALFKIGSSLHIHRLIPTVLMRRANFITYFLFGVKQTKHKRLLKEILWDTDDAFLRWAINAITQWENKCSTTGIRIHGTKDQLLPIATSTKYRIENAGHFTIVTHGSELTRIIELETSQ